MSLKEKIINLLLGVIFFNLRQYPKIGTRFIELDAINKDYHKLLETFTVINGTVIPEACASEGTTLLQAIKRTKKYINEMTKNNVVWVRIMPECRVFNNWYHIRARFAVLPKEEAGKYLPWERACV